MILLIDGPGPLGDFNRQILGICDPDFVLLLDSALERYAWEEALNAARVQPFSVLRYTEGMEARPPTNAYVVDGPVVPGDAEPPEVMDVDALGFDWHLAALLGLAPRGHSAPFRLKRSWEEGEPIHTILDERERFLTSNATSTPWLMLADKTFGAAAQYWSLRALGARPYWLSEDELQKPRPPEVMSQHSRLFLFAPNFPGAEEVAERWSLPGALVELPPADLSQVLIRGETAFSKGIFTVHPHRGRLVFASPPPPSLGEKMYTFVPGVASIRVQSSDPRSPDGVLLPVTTAAQELVGEGDGSVRVTREGIAQLTSLAKSEVLEYPDVDFFDAVEAAVRDGGITLEHSDKGRYQQRTLALARGLRFLAWVLRHPQSQHLLRLFQTYHLSGQPPPGYRRAVTYQELREAVLEELSARRKTIRSELRRRADDWLARWSEDLLARGLLRRGYVLRCSVCAARAWYASDDVGQGFECTRCHSLENISPRSMPSFQLNEAFFQFMEHHGEVVTLSLARLRDAARTSFLYVPEAQLRGAINGEIDAVALVDGALVAVEAKSNGKLADTDLSKLRRLASRARLDVAILATTSRDQPLCAELRCEECRHRFGTFHRDYAWKEGARRRIEELRNALPDSTVASFCFESLAGDGEAELARYEGDRIPRRPQFG